MRNNRLASLKPLLLALAFAWAIPAVAALELVERSGDKGNFLFENDPRSLVTSIDFVVLAGSVHDPKGKEGLTSLAFDALLRGTKTKSRDEFANSIETLGGSISASTGFLRSWISLSVINENVAPALELLAETMTSPGFRTTEFSQLHKERLAQLDQARSSPPRVLFRAVREAMFRGTPLSHSPDGTIDSLKRVKLADARALIARQIVDGNVVVAVSSKLPKEAVKQQIEATFARLSQGPPSPVPAMHFPKVSGRHLVILERKGLTTVPASIVHGTVGSTYPRLPELGIGNFILGGSMSSRLFNVLRNENGWTYGAQSSFQQFDQPRKYGGSFSIYTFPASEHAMKAIPRAVELYHDFEQKGLTPEELEFAKNSLVNSYAFEFVSAGSRLSGRLAEALDGVPYLSIDEYAKRVRGMSQAEVLAVIHEAHDSANFILGVAGDPKAMKELMSKIPGITSVRVIKDPIQKLE